MPAIVRNWKKFLSIGCTHGIYADPDAIAAAFAFKLDYKPDVTIHHGDVSDYPAFRSGAKGTADEAAAIGPDVDAGMGIIEQFEPNVVLIGNHDERVFKASEHHNAIIARAASSCRNDFLSACEKVHARVIDHYSVKKSVYPLGNFHLIHGWKFGENALRDHARAYGNIIMAQLHSPGMAHGDTFKSSRAYCVGMLADIDKLDYAHRRFATLKWALGFAYGEFCDDETIIHISECECGNAKNWVLPR